MDGVSHINIYSKGKTDLGRWLSNFTYSPFICEDGKFNSVEGYWYWIGCRDYRLVTASGFSAKKIGREVPRSIELFEGAFREKILNAIECKVRAYPSRLQEFIESSLPFQHYYMYGDKKVPPKGLEWLVEGVEELRLRLRE